MKRVLVLFGLAACLAAPAAHAQESPESQLDFVRKLRSKGYTDLALQYLESMPASPTTASAILLEKARTRMALARSLDPERRVNMINLARGELDQFIKSNPGPAEAMAVRLEKARVSTFQGQAILSKALREDGTKAQQAAALPAEQMFIQAGKEIEEATKGLKDDDERRQARFDLGINMMDQARTYIDLSGGDLNLKRAQIVDNARKVFEKVYEDDKKGELGLLAAAWLVKCCQEGDDPKMASKYYADVMNSSSKTAEPAQRWARYFRIEYIPRNPTSKVKDKIAEIQKEAQAWLKDYPAHHKSMPGYGVRYELGYALAVDAQNPNLKDAKVQAAKTKQAQEVLASLNEPDNDFAEKASRLNLGLSLRNIGEKTTATDLNTFDELFLRAQVELNTVKKFAAQLEQAKAPDESAKLEKGRQQAFKEAIRSLSRAVAVADIKVAPSKIDEARYLLVASYLLSGDQHRAAIAGEAMAYSLPPTAKSPLAAGYAIEAYANIFNRDKSENNRARLSKLADFVLSPTIQKQWASEPVTGVAHYQLALLHQKDGNTKQALEHMQKLPKEFPGFVYVQSQLVFLALDAREKAQNPQEKKHYYELARKVLAGLPKLTANIDGSSATMYFHAQLEEAKFLYAEAAELLQKNDAAKSVQKYQQMGAFLDGLAKELALPGLKLNEDKEKLAYYLDTMRKYSRLGLAEVDYRNGQYDKVLGPEQTGAVVDQIKAAAAKDPVVRVKDFQITGDILGLALRANVQKGKVDDAKVILKLLENLRGPEDNAFADSTGVLRNLVQELKDQVRDLQRAGNKDQLKKTVANFSEFVDALVKQAEKKGMDLRDIFFLAQCYDSLDQHEKAATLYAKYAVPKFLDAKKKAPLPPGTDEKLIKKDKEIRFTIDEETELQKYWFVQVRHAQQLRLAKKLPEAQKVLDGLSSHANARQQLMAEKEQTHLLEDNGQFGKAITRWSQFMNNPNLKKNLGNDPKLKEDYFNAYYHLALCWYKYSQTEKVKAAGKDAQFLSKAADYIVRLESSTNPEGWQIAGPRFRALMQSEKMLEDAYKRQKGS